MNFVTFNRTAAETTAVVRVLICLRWGAVSAVLLMTAQSAAQVPTDLQPSS
jgi:hypothetical protein